MIIDIAARRPDPAARNTRPMAAVVLPLPLPVYTCT